MVSDGARRQSLAMTPLTETLAAMSEHTHVDAATAYLATPGRPDDQLRKLHWPCMRRVVCAERQGESCHGESHI